MTQSDIGIVEKLKAKTHCAVRVAGGPEFVNPDGPEAAAIITEMVEALEGMVLAAERDAHENNGISGFTGARLSDARDTLAKVRSK